MSSASGWRAISSATSASALRAQHVVMVEQRDPLAARQVESGIGGMRNVAVLCAVDDLDARVAGAATSPGSVGHAAASKQSSAMQSSQCG